MIGEITPLVQAANKGIWRAALVAHTFGAVVSATMLGLVLGTVGLLCTAAVQSLSLNSHAQSVLVSGAGLVLVACGLREAGLVSIRLPSLQRQTPQWLKRDFGPVWSSLLWGMDLGQGWSTHILYTGYYGLVICMILMGTPLQGAAILAAFGLGRALPVVIAGIWVRRVVLLGERGSPPLLLQQPVLQLLNAIVLGFSGAFLFSAWT